MKRNILLTMVISLIMAACSLPGQNAARITETNEPVALPTETATEIPVESPTEIPTDIPPPEPTETPTEIPTPTAKPHSSVLVVYFSRTGE